MRFHMNAETELCCRNEHNDLLHSYILLGPIRNRFVPSVVLYDVKQGYVILNLTL